jgi:hypothetical protein
MDQPEQFGIKVDMRHKTFGSIIYRNVTEIHYLYPSLPGNMRVAFESDIHATGVTWPVEEVLEFEATLESGNIDEFAQVQGVTTQEKSTE